MSAMVKLAKDPLEHHDIDQHTEECHLMVWPCEREVHDTVRSDIQTEAQTQPKLELPSVADIQCTQNAGHKVVIPSGGGIAAIPRVEHGRAIDVS